VCYEERISLLLCIGEAGGVSMELPAAAVVISEESIIFFISIFILALAASDYVIVSVL